MRTNPNSPHRKASPGICQIVNTEDNMSCFTSHPCSFDQPFENVETSFYDHSHGLDLQSRGNSAGVQDNYEDIHQWRASTTTGAMTSPDFFAHRGISPDNANMMFLDGKEPSTLSHTEMMFAPDSPLFNCDDLQFSPAVDGSFPSSFAPVGAPIMEYSVSGGTTESYGDFPSREWSFHGEVQSPRYLQGETSPEVEVPQLEMYGLGAETWSPSSGSMELSLSLPTAGSAPVLPEMITPAMGLSQSNDDRIFSPASQSGSKFDSATYDCIDLRSSHLYIGEGLPSPGQPFPFGPHGTGCEFPPRTKAFFSNRLSADGENIKARQHGHYERKPADDGLYYCPYANEGCRRKPDKLKCNYDKHLDSHLKPYRCQDKACADVPFSSTACLLRHEREAHGLHGHGDRPFPCQFENCERALPGNGFPRRWNLQDHMKRVHNFVEPELDGASSQEPNRVRKKKGGSSAATSARRNSRSVPYRSRS